MTWLIAAIAAAPALLGLLHIRQPVRGDLDTRRCYLQPVDRPDSVYSHRHLVCWPKAGVFMAGDRAIAWRVGGLAERGATARD